MDNLALFVAGFFIAWCMAHFEVATECEKQGSFYVGDTVYECRPTHNGGEYEQ